MKKIIATLTFLVMMFVMLPFAANAQTRQGSRYSSRSYESRTYSRPSFYKRHRNAINVGVGTGAGALLGAIIGGKKGAAIGALAGAGGSALYTYKIKPKYRRY
jgi:outer membrane lipoprotein SlyB